MTQKALLFKYLYRSHTIIGLIVLCFFYISTYFGTLTLFMPYIKVWESPSRHFVSSANHSFNIDTLLDRVLVEHQFVGAKPIDIMLPSFRDPLIKISSESQNSLYINPLSHEVLKIAKEENLISSFFNELHTGGVLPLIGMPLMGAMSIGILFLSIGGVWLYFTKRDHQKHTHKPWKQTWMSWHKMTGLGVLPYALVFSLTGAFLGLLLSTSHPFAWAMSEGKANTMRQLVAPILFPPAKYPRIAQSAEMLPFSLLLEKAKTAYPSLSITHATFYHYGTAGAKVFFRGYDSESSVQSGRFNRVGITLDAHNGGDVIEKKTLEDSHIIKRVLSTFYFLHFVPDETLGVRLILALFGCLMAFSLVTGYLLWAEKKLYQQGIVGDMMNRVGIAVMIGILPASTLVPCLHWILPHDLFDKEIWIRGSFYAFWSFWLFYCVYERSIARIIRLMLTTSAWLLIGTVLFHELKSGYFLWTSFTHEAWVLFSIDLGLLVGSIVLFSISKWVETKALFYRYERKGVFDGY